MTPSPFIEGTSSSRLRLLPATIIRGRPYARKDELVQKKILPESVYNEIKDNSSRRDSADIK